MVLPAGSREGFTFPNILPWLSKRGGIGASTVHYPLPVPTVSAVLQSPAPAAIPLEPNIAIPCCYHLLCVDALLISMSFTQRCALKDADCCHPSVPPCPGWLWLQCSTEHPSSQLHRGEG